MDPNQRCSLNDSRNSPDTSTTTISDQASDSSEDTTNISQKFESSLHISEELESKSTASDPIQQCNISQSSSLEESIPNVMPKQATLKESTHYPSHSSSSKWIHVESVELPVDLGLYSPCETSIVPEHISGLQPPLQHLSRDQASRSSYSQRDSRNLPSTAPAQYPPGHYPNVNPTGMHTSTTFAPNQAYTQQSLRIPNVSEMTHFSQPVSSANPSHFYQIQHPNVMLPGQPAFLPPTMATLYYPNQFPNVSAHVPPIIFTQTPPRFERSVAPVISMAPPGMLVQPTQRAAPNIVGEIDRPPEEIQGRFDLSPEIPNQIFTLPALQKNTASSTNHKQNTASLKCEERKKLTKVERQAKSTHYSKRNMLNIDIPESPSPKSLFPLYSTPPGGVLLRPLTPPPFPKRISSDLVSFASARDANIHQGTTPQIGFYQQSISHDFYPPQGVILPSQVHVPIQSTIQALMPSRAQYQSVIQNPVTRPQLQVQYTPMHIQGTNISLNQGGTHMTLQPNISLPFPRPMQLDNRNTVPMQPAAANLSLTSGNPNLTFPTAMQNIAIQSGSHQSLPLSTAIPPPIMPPYQSVMPYPIARPPYFDPAVSMYPHRAHSQHAMHDPTAVPHYQNPNILMNQGRTQIPSQTDRSFNPTPGLQRGYTNTVPMQPTIVNPRSYSKNRNPTRPK